MYFRLGHSKISLKILVTKKPIKIELTTVPVLCKVANLFYCVKKHIKFLFIT